MIPELILSALVACMATIIFFTVKSNMKLQDELHVIHEDMFALEEKLRITTEECRSLTEEKAWKAGMELGRKSDALYRQIVKKYTGDQQFSVMINGVEEDEL